MVMANLKDSIWGRENWMWLSIRCFHHISLILSLTCVTTRMLEIKPKSMLIFL